MWRIHLRFADLALCPAGACSGCPSPDREPRSSAAAATSCLRVPRIDAVAMQTLRQIVQRHDLGVASVSRSTDDQVVARVERMIESGRLRVCRDAGAAASAVDLERCASDAALAPVLALQSAGDLVWRGRSFRIIPAGQWARYRETSDYDLMPKAQARDVLGSMSGEARRPDAERRTLASALELLCDDGRASPDGRIVLLRAALARMTTSNRDDVITPSAFARAMASRAQDEDEDTHWIEIEMLGDDGVGIPLQEYVIETPDQRRFTGVTDDRGRARVDGIVAGQCWVSFRNLDKGAWRAA